MCLAETLAILESGKDVKVFFYALDVSVGRLAQYASLLNKEEKLRAESFRFKRHSNRFVVGRGVLRSILGSLGGCAPQEVEFAYSRYGKPNIIVPNSLAGFEFSVSNSEGMGAVAIGKFGKLGLDIEYVAVNSESVVGVSRMLAESEQFWLSLQSSENNKAFHQLWTCKEAYLKARGSGLYEPLDGFSISMRCLEKPKLLQGFSGDNVDEWEFRQINIEDNFAGCLTVRGELDKIFTEKWPFKVIN